MPGVEGFWVFVAGDLAIFTLLFVAFARARAMDPAGFEHARLLLDPDRGGVNTLLLLTSSWCVVQAFRRTRAGEETAAARWLVGAVVGGAGFAAVKIQEYAAAAAAGHTPSVSPFFTYYYSLTGLHLAHVLVGTALLGVLLVRCRTGRGTGARGFETIACFWHLVDLLWVVIFPLLYLVR